ncbi:MAG: hypothetical protein K1X57_06825 [Gemmataceae bacterium]|nr:hypothetical protein [Gemmataceae bacterium]
MSEQNMSQFWEQLPAIMSIGLIFGGALIAGIVSMICNAWKGNRESERLAVLKQQMLDRGMSADEIVRVIGAGKASE